LLCNLYIYTMNDAFNFHICTLVLTNLTIFHYIEDLYRILLIKFSPTSKALYLGLAKFGITVQALNCSLGVSVFQLLLFFNWTQTAKQLKLQDDSVFATVCHCLIIQHVLHLHPLQNVPIRSPTLLLQMFLRFHRNIAK
jgi:hypothetical protein